VSERGRRILEAFNVRDGEGPRVFGLAFYLVLAVSTFISGRIQRDSLFLTAFSKEDLAFMYISVAVMVPVPALLFSRVADRFRRDKLLIFSLATTIICMGAMRALLLLEARWVYILLYNFVEVYGTFLILQFWTFAGDLFSSREAKRLFPIISAGSVVAGIVCGLFVGGVVKVMGTANLLFLQMLLLACGAVIIRGVGHRERARLRDIAALGAVRNTKSRKGKGHKAVSAASNVFQSKHLKIVAGMTVATFVTVPLIDYQFKVLVKEHFTAMTAAGAVVDTDAISAFMGMFSAATGIIAAVMQLGLTGRILERFGVVFALLLLPLTLLGGLFAMLVGVGTAFACAVFTKGAENSFRYSITDATMQVLYTPVPSQARGRAKTFIDGVIKPMAGGLAGGAMVLLVGPLKLPIQSLAVVAVILVACWVGLILLIRREYVKELLSTLRRRRLDFSDKSLVINDKNTVDMLRARLRGDDDIDVRNAIELCRRVQGHDLSNELMPLLKRDDAAVRIAALELLADRSASERAATVDPAVIEAIFRGDVNGEGAADDDNDAVRAAAVGAYCAVVGENAIGVVENLLHSPSPAIRGAAVAGIIRFGGLEGILHAADDLKAMLASEDEAMRYSCAHVLESIAIKGFHGPVQILLGDSSPRVQLSAIAAAGAMCAPELIPSLIYKLRQRETSRAAQAALALYGDDVIDALLRVARQQKEDPLLRKSVPRVLERIGSRSALDALLQALFVVDDDETRRELARATARLRDRLGIAVDDVAIRKLIDDETRRHYQLLAMMSDLAAVAEDPRRDLLRDALEARAQRSLEGVFRLLGIIQPFKAIETVWGNLRSQSPVSRANAVEVLDNLLESEEKRSLLPLVEASAELSADRATASRALARMLERGHELYTLTHKSPEAWLEEMLHSPDPWLVICALFVVTELGLQGVSDVVAGHLKHENPIVRETALHAYSVLVPPAQFVQSCTPLAADPHTIVSRVATRLLQTATSNALS
jgi:ATP/ADP translocase/HEAT repeat protein